MLYIINRRIFGLVGSLSLAIMLVSGCGGKSLKTQKKNNSGAEVTGEVATMEVENRKQKKERK